MNDSITDDLKQFKPRAAPVEWRRTILATAVQSVEPQEGVSWWEVFRIPLPIQYSVAVIWLLILILKAATPVIDRGVGTAVTYADLKTYHFQVQLVADGNWPLYVPTDEGAHFEIKLYEN